MTQNQQRGGLHALILCRGERMGTPDGQQARGFKMYRRALRRELGFTFTQVDSFTLDEAQRAIDAHPADVVVMLPSWAEPAPKIIEFFRGLYERPARPKLVFYDYYAPTSSPHFGVLPYVDRYVKRQLLRDRSQYQVRYAGGFIFADFMATHFGFDLKDWHFGSDLDLRHASKLRLGWNLGVTPRYRYLLRFTRLFGRSWRRKPFDINLRLGLVSRPGRMEWYQHYRDRALKAIEGLSSQYRCTESGRIPPRDYLFEMTKSRIVFSPFGWGELCFRDYEAVCCGALLVKPSMEHLETSPDIFVPNKTYVPVRWDLTDVEQVCRYYLSHPDEAARIARNAQEALGSYFERGGFVRDVSRMIDGL